jgi:hypothetical protein
MSASPRSKVCSLRYPSNMRVRRVIITKNANVNNIETLPLHPNVRKCWRLPREYVLFEFYHPVFERIYDQDPAVANAARSDEIVRSQTAEAIAEERNLLAPLYRDIGNPSNALTLLVPSKAATYFFVGRGKGRISWPRTGYSPGWESSTRIRVDGRLFMALPEAVEGLRTVLREWSDSMTKIGEMKAIETLIIDGTHFSAICEFEGPCGDAAMALFMLLTETRNLSSLEAVGFFFPDDISSTLFEAGDP